MYETREIRLDDKEAVDGIVRRYRCLYSSHAFNSLYLWRNQMRLELYLSEDFFAVKCGTRGKNTWFFPCGDALRIKEFIDYMIGLPDFQLCYMGKKEKTFLQNYKGILFRIDREYDSDEYIYEIQGHLSLQGKNYANVRTQLHKAERENNCVTKRLSEVKPEEIREILNEWNANEGHGSDIEFATDAAELEALEHFEHLEMDGVVVFLDGQPFGVAMGFPLTEDTFDLFAAKERKVLPGMAYYVKHELFLYLNGNYTYVNIEEDMGNEGLRRMKKTLCPIRQNVMWTASIRR